MQAFLEKALISLAFYYLCIYVIRFFTCFESFSANPTYD
jgi:hypothetical protein